ncbi:MAG: hypothetical protein RL699_285 [Bacteroidota bacterium]
MVKLVDMPDLGSGAARRVGSSPITRTTSSNICLGFFYTAKREVPPTLRGYYPHHELKLSLGFFYAAKREVPPILRGYYPHLFSSNLVWAFFIPQSVRFPRYFGAITRTTSSNIYLGFFIEIEPKKQGE